MAYRVEWSPRAIEDLEAIAEYIALDSTAYSRAVVKTILESTRNFSQFPFAAGSYLNSAMKVFVNRSLIAIESSIELRERWSRLVLSFMASVWLTVE